MFHTAPRPHVIAATKRMVADIITKDPEQYTAKDKEVLAIEARADAAAEDFVRRDVPQSHLKEASHAWVEQLLVAKWPALYEGLNKDEQRELLSSLLTELTDNPIHSPYRRE